VIKNYSDQRIASHIRWYGQEEWNAKKIEGRMKAAREWADKHGVAIICDEWGTYKQFCPPKYRNAWLRDVRTACEKFDIGWCMWTFDGSFGVVDREDGELTVDVGVAKALGLNVD
jgi:hypothetical protein